MAKANSTRPCSINGCTRPHSSKGMCNVHYLRVLNNGTPYMYCKDCGGQLPVEASGNKKICDTCRTRTTCKVSGCTEPLKRHGFCYAHYMKNWRYGTPTPTHESTRTDLIGERFGTLVVARLEGEMWFCECDCGGSRIARTGDLNRGGDTNTCGNRSTHLSDDVGYSGAHDRVRKVYGPATAHKCSDCGDPAAHWSYNHDDANEMVDDRGLKYSINPDHYRPRCVPCHKVFDLGVIGGTFGRNRTVTPPLAPGWSAN